MLPMPPLASYLFPPTPQMQINSPEQGLMSPLADSSLSTPIDSTMPISSSFAPRYSPLPTPNPRGGGGVNLGPEMLEIDPIFEGYKNMQLIQNSFLAYQHSQSDVFSNNLLKSIDIMRTSF